MNNKEKIAELENQVELQNFDQTQTKLLDIEKSQQLRKLQQEKHEIEKNSL